MSATTDRVFILRTPLRENTLDGYIFADRKHATDWLAQPFTRGYYADEWQGVWRRCPCGSRRTFYPQKLITKRAIEGVAA